MKTKYEVYQEYFSWYFDGLEAPDEDEPITKFDMESLGFQSYLARYYLNGLVDIMCELIICLVKKIIDFIKKYFNKLIGRQA